MIILGIRAVAMYRCFVLIDLINDNKNIYYHNNNVCLRVFKYTFQLDYKYDYFLV